MVNRIILCMIFFNIVLEISSQNISINRDCQEKNTAVFSQSLIDLKGEKFISKILEKHIYYLMFCEVDSLGYVLNIKKIRSKKEISKKLIKQIESYLIEKNIRFDICYNELPNKKPNETIELLKKELSTKKDTTYIINVSFPGTLLYLYDYEQNHINTTDSILTKYTYLKKQIRKYNGISQ